MSASVALTEPAKVAGFGILSGRIWPEVLPLVKASAALASLPASVSHGVQDGVLGVHFAHHAKQVFDGLGLALSLSRLSRRTQPEPCHGARFQRMARRTAQFTCYIKKLKPAMFSLASLIGFFFAAPTKSRSSVRARSHTARNISFLDA